MTGFKMLAAVALISAIPATSALAQEPAAFQAMFPNRDVLNGGALTPAGRLGLEQPYGAPNADAANNANAGMVSASPSIQRPRYHGNRRRHLSR
jgi:hypothetical protein